MQRHVRSFLLVPLWEYDQQDRSVVFHTLCDVGETGTARPAASSKVVKLVGWVQRQT